jgi:hypothetical protein
MTEEIQSTHILNDGYEHECYICKKKNKTGVLQLNKCMHKYHVNCLMHYVKNTYSNICTVFNDHYPTYCVCCKKEYNDPRIDFTLYLMTNFQLQNN